MLVDPISEKVKPQSKCKTTLADTKLTVAGPTDLADMTGSVFNGTDGAGSGAFTQTPYRSWSPQMPCQARWFKVIPAASIC